MTNDDGPDSPALVPFARALARVCGEVRVVIPDRERSWVGKAITRFEPVAVRVEAREGLELHVCTGYPADAVQLAVDGLFDDPPRLVVSGINLGYNHGAGLIMSSGTVGAATEGWVSGIGAVAVSTGTVGDWTSWKAEAHAPETRPRWERLAALAARLVGDLVEAGATELADVVNVNIPFEADDTTPRRITRPARTGYDRLFRPVGDGVFVHDFGGGLREFAALEGTDVEAAHRGWISITALQMPQAVDVPIEIRRRIEAWS